MLGPRPALFLACLVALLALVGMRLSPPTSGTLTSALSQPLKQARKLLAASGRAAKAAPSLASTAHTAAAATAAAMPPAVRHIPAGSLTVSKPTWWLESRFHFR